ncbi:hypothetical protein Hanom_Chr00s000001g01596261 [Helianthus anomalus]
MEGDVGGSQEAAGVGPERSDGLGNAFNYDAFMDCGSGSASQPVGKKGFFVFNSREKSKRQRRGGSKYQGSCESPFFNLDSNEKARPTKRKRNKAHIVEDSDPFSLEKILDPVNGMNVRGNGDGDAISGFSGGNTESGGCRSLDLNQGLDVDRSSSSNVPRRGEEGVGGEGVDAVDAEVAETVRIGVRLGMELGNKEEIIKRVIQGKGINELKS